MSAALAAFADELEDLGALWKPTAQVRSPAPRLDLTAIGRAGFVLRVQAYDVADEFVEPERNEVEIAIVAHDEVGRELLETTFSLAQADAALSNIRSIVSEEIAIELDFDDDDEWLGSGTVRTAALKPPSETERVSRRSFHGTFDWPQPLSEG
ncbi:MAG: hypothetical protein M3Y18_06635 [Candidatus Eremiobacteraeota bacterium]|nr:hypothetical protein [Candidatus Eremiobacteraeota bacterium]